MSRSVSRQRKISEFSIWAIHKAGWHITNLMANLLAKLTLHMRSLFIYILKLKCACIKVQIQANSLGICPLWIHLYALNRWLTILLMALLLGKMTTRHFSGCPIRKNWKSICSVGRSDKRYFRCRRNAKKTRWGPKLRYSKKNQNKEDEDILF